MLNVLLFQVFVKLRKKSSSVCHHFVVKQTIPAKTDKNKEILRNSYFNEIHFYDNIVKQYEKFANSFPNAKKFDKVPKAYAVRAEEGKEKIVMENLKELGFQMLPRNGNFNDEHMKLLMEVYGEFHGVSAAFREHNPEGFQKLTGVFKNSTENALELARPYIPMMMKNLIELVEDESIKQKLKIYTEKGAELAINSLQYNGKNPVVNQGDCWSNNVMLKYDVSIKLHQHDFQKLNHFLS